MPRRTHYVNNKSLYKEILLYKDNGEISEDLHLMFYKMCEKNIQRFRFNRYTKEWKEDMIHTAYLKCLTVVEKFDRNRTNPFSYFTTVISNCFLDYTAFESKQKKIKENLKELFENKIDY